MPYSDHSLSFTWTKTLLHSSLAVLGPSPRSLNMSLNDCTVAVYAHGNTPQTRVPISDSETKISYYLSMPNSDRALNSRRMKKRVYLGRRCAVHAVYIGDTRISCRWRPKSSFYCSTYGHLALLDKSSSYHVDCAQNPQKIHAFCTMEFDTSCYGTAQFAPQFYKIIHLNGGGSTGALAVSLE